MISDRDLLPMYTDEEPEARTYTQASDRMPDPEWNKRLSWLLEWWNRTYDPANAHYA